MKPIHPSNHIHPLSLSLLFPTKYEQLLNEIIMNTTYNVSLLMFIHQILHNILQCKLLTVKDLGLLSHAICLAGRLVHIFPFFLVSTYIAYLVMLPHIGKGLLNHLWWHMRYCIFLYGAVAFIREWTRNTSKAQAKLS